MWFNNMIKKIHKKVTENTQGLIFHPTYAPLTGLAIIISTLYLSYKSFINDKAKVIVSNWGTLTFSGVLFAIGIIFIIAPFIKIYFESKQKK